MQPFFKTFDCGLRLIYKRVEENRPASVFVMVKTGSSNETEENNGISHLIEHLNFKGTTKRSAKQISVELEEIGANANAFTSKFNTCFYATTLNENLEKSFDILSDIVFNSSYSEKEIEKEKKVVFEEIDMYQDDPETVCQEEFYKNFYFGTPLSQTILGTKESVSKITREQILKYIKTYYTANRVIVSVVGNLENEKVINLTKKYFLKFFDTKMEIEEPVKSSLIIPDKKFSFVKKDIMQTQICFGFPCENIYSENRTAHILLGFIFGGGMGSRLFQKVREEHGLVYTISCLPELNQNGGDFVISLGTNKQNECLAMKLIKEEIDILVQNGFTDKELKRAKTFCKSLLLSSTELGLDIAKSNASNIGTYNKFVSVDEKIKEIENCSLDSVNDLAKKIFNYSNVCGAVVSKDINEDLFNIFN